jgi:hypothetical protein
MIGHTELVSHARDHGRGLLVTKESLLAGDAAPLTAALLQVISNSSFKQQVGMDDRFIGAEGCGDGGEVQL